MKKLSIILFSCLALSGCLEVSNSGVGATSDGAQLSGTMTYNAMGTAGVFTLTSLDGRRCQGEATFSADDVSEFPLSCNDGVTGQAISTINRFASQQTISFRLSNGETGSVTLGAV